MKHINNIIIIGTNHHNTLSMVRCFGEEDLNVKLYIYGDNRSYIASSNYVDEVSYFDSAEDAVAAIPSDHLNKPLVIACSDEISSLMDLKFDDFVQRCYFFNASEKGIITTLMDKQNQLELAKECGFLVPDSIEIFPNLIDLPVLHYPCLVKPKESIHGGKNIYICRNVEELKEALNKFNHDYKVLIQDYIKKDYEIVVLGVSIEEQIIIPGYIQKHRDDKGGTTYSTVHPIANLDNKVVESCFRLLKKTRYQGLWGIECIKQDENFFFLELNLRNDATTYALKVAGVNLPLLYLRLMENPQARINMKSIRTIDSMVEFNDFNFVLKRKVGLFQWIRELKNSECKYFYSKDDPKPFKHMQRKYMRFLMNRMLHK